jgi:hypothetical protein
MFEVDQFIAVCRATFAEDMTHNGVREVMARAVSDPGAVLKGLGEPKRAVFRLVAVQIWPATVAQFMQQESAVDLRQHHPSSRSRSSLGAKQLVHIDDLRTDDRRKPPGVRKWPAMTSVERSRKRPRVSC